MTDAARKARNEYVRNWKRENPERVKKHQERYWEKKAQELAAQADNEGEG